MSSHKNKMVYVAVPFWHENQEVRNYRRQKAIEYSEKLFNKNIPFYSPLLYSERFKEKKASEGYWVKHGLRMVDVCDEMHVLCLDGWEESSGISGEVARAQLKGAEVKYIYNHSRVSFHGSRTLTMRQVRPVFESVMERMQVHTVVTHGEPSGACSHVRSLCKDMGIPLMLHHLDRGRAQGMHHWRSVSVLDDSDTAIFLHDGTSQGTSNELALAIKTGAPHEYYVLSDGILVRKETSKEKSDVINEEQDELASLEIEYSFEM